MTRVAYDSCKCVGHPFNCFNHPNDCGCNTMTIPENKKLQEPLKIRLIRVCEKIKSNVGKDKDEQDKYYLGSVLYKEIWNEAIERVANMSLADRSNPDIIRGLKK